MTKEQTKFRPKDIYFRIPTEDREELVAKVETVCVKLDGARYKDKYFQIQCATDGVTFSPQLGPAP